MEINANFYRQNPDFRGYLNGHYYAIPVSNGNVPPGIPESEVKSIKEYYPAFEVRWCPLLRCWGLFQRMSVSIMRKSGQLVKGNGIDDEFVFCGRIKTFTGLAENVRKNDPYKITNFKEHLRKIHQRNKDERAKIKRTVREDMLHLGRDNKEWLKRWYRPLEYGTQYEFDGTKL